MNMPTIDFSHLSFLEFSLHRERLRLSAAKSEGERALRAVWVRQSEKEIAGEREFLKLPPEEKCDLSEEDLLAELGF